MIFELWCNCETILLYEVTVSSVTCIFDFSDFWCRSFEIPKQLWCMFLGFLNFVYFCWKLSGSTAKKNLYLETGLGCRIVNLSSSIILNLKGKWIVYYVKGFQNPRSGHVFSLSLRVFEFFLEIFLNHRWKNYFLFLNESSQWGFFQKTNLFYLNLILTFIAKLYLFKALIFPIRLNFSNFHYGGWQTSF